MDSTLDEEDTIAGTECRRDTESCRIKMDEQGTNLCGIGAFKPGFLQPFNRMGVVTGAFSVSASLTMTLSLYIASQITAIEKHFGLNSSQSGFLLSCNDIGFLLATMLASYAARHVHIPRVLFASMCIYGLGGWVCSAAYFVSQDIFKSRVGELEKMAENMSKKYSLPSGKVPPLCSLDSHSTINATVIGNDDNTFDIGLPNKYSTIAMVLIGAGMLVQGVCKSIRSPFMVTYIDDNGSKKNTAMYTGFVFAAIGFGPAIAFGVGGLFSKIYVTLEDVRISPKHPSWIGAWWLGFVVFGLVSIVASLPLACFPRHMKPRVTVVEEKAEPKHHMTSTRAICHASLDFVKIIMRLVTNRVFGLVLIYKGVTTFMIAGITAFGAKYVETQFFLPAWKANIFMGLTTMLPVCLGSTVSGLWVSKRRLTPLQCIKLLMVTTVADTVLFSSGYFLGCSNPAIVGLNSDIQRNVSGTNASCGAACNCDPNRYFPVCGSDGRNYFSPCVAGCTSESMQSSAMLGSEATFTDCGCVAANVTVVPGLCATDCRMLVPFLLMYTVVSIITTLHWIPTIIVGIRSVKDKDKSMAIGLMSLMTTVFGWLIGPVVYGRIVDATCLVWTTSRDLKGACALYDNDLFRIAATSFAMGPKVITCILMLLMFRAARRKTDWSVDSTRSEDADVEPDTTNPLLITQETPELKN